MLDKNDVSDRILRIANKQINQLKILGIDEDRFFLPRQAVGDLQRTVFDIARKTNRMPAIFLVLPFFVCGIDKQAKMLFDQELLLSDDLKISDIYDTYRNPYFVIVGDQGECYLTLAEVLSILRHNGWPFFCENTIACGSIFQNDANQQACLTVVGREIILHPWQVERSSSYIPVCAERVGVGSRGRWHIET